MQRPPPSGKAITPARWPNAIRPLPGSPTIPCCTSSVACVFALHRYKEAAATIYAVLSIGPGWDWTTLASLYPDIDVYTQQLRDLEQYVNVHRDEADASSCWRTSILTCGHPTLPRRSSRRRWN